MNGELETIVERFENAVRRMDEAIYEAKEDRDEVIEKLRDVPCPELNELISWGFVPGQKVLCLGKPYTFKGYTQGMQMVFEDEKHKIHYSDIKRTVKILERFVKVDETPANQGELKYEPVPQPEQKI